MSPIRKFRLDSPFSKEKSAYILSMFHETKSLSKVIRGYRKKFFPTNPRNVPQRNTFQRLLDRFETETSVRPIMSVGRAPVTPEDVDRVKQYFRRNKKNHIRQAVVDLGFGFGKIWRILRKNLQ